MDNPLDSPSSESRSAQPEDATRQLAVEVLVGSDYSYEDNQDRKVRRITCAMPTDRRTGTTGHPLHPLQGERGVSGDDRQLGAVARGGGEHRTAEAVVFSTVSWGEQQIARTVADVAVAWR